MNEAGGIQELIQYTLDNKGLAEGNKILDWIEEKIRVETKITHATFGELYELHQKDPKKYKQLYLMGTNLNKTNSEIFSHEDTPNVIISDAVRISMSIPIVFRPHQCYEKKDDRRQLAKNDLYADGGLMDNYPIWLFDKEEIFQQI
jgi:NTE family protein